MEWSEKTILLTGGTGTLGQKFTEVMLRKHKPRVIRIFSRDELKQYEMEKRFNSDRRLRFFIGDVRDKSRMERAMVGVDIVIHAAALKQVPLCEYNPFEAVKTNILGAQNIIDCAIDHNVEKVMAISSESAVNPVNVYGATKMCMEKLFVSANSYIGDESKTRMSCVRYGNVSGSRGSVIPLFQKQKASGIIGITDKGMTRFWISLEKGVEFVIKTISMMQGGEIFVPRIPSVRILDLAELVGEGCRIKEIGIRPGEKMHECLLTEDEARHSIEMGDFFIIEPEHYWWNKKKPQGRRSLPAGFRYDSDNNNVWLNRKQLKKVISE